MQDHSASCSHEVLVVGLSGYLADGLGAKNAVLLSSMDILVAIWRPDYTVTLIRQQEFQGTKTQVNGSHRSFYSLLCTLPQTLFFHYYVHYRSSL